MVLPVSTSGRVATALFVLYIVALNPPVVTAVGRTPPVMGVAPLYLWFVVWGVFGSLVLVWAAYRDAFGLTDEQIPPDISVGSERPWPSDADSDGHSEGD